jgi:hypothetical protein
LLGWIAAAWGVPAAATSAGVFGAGAVDTEVGAPVTSASEISGIAISPNEGEIIYR